MAQSQATNQDNLFKVIVRFLNTSGKMVDFFSSKPMPDVYARAYHLRMDEIYPKHSITTKRFISLRAA